MRAWLRDQVAACRSDAFVHEFTSLLDLPGDIRDAAHYIPGHLTASGFVISPDRQALLLIHHAKLGKWLQPGGHVESFDDTLEGAARREVSEETGLGEFHNLGFLDLDVHDIPARREQPAHQHFDVRFAFQAETSDVAALDGVLDVAWVPFGELSAVGADESVLRPAEKLRAG